MLLAAALPPSAATAADESSSLAGIDTIVRGEIAAGHIPGAVILVGHRGRIIYRGAFGAAAVIPARRAMQPDAIFDLASLTKAVATTTAVMQLAEAGRIRLDDPVSSYWPAFAAAGKRGVTIRQLLTHTAGLRPDLEGREDWSGEAGALRRVAAERPLWRPGSEFHYSDVGFLALGALVERVSGEPLDVYCRRHIFAPLGMNDTGFRPGAAARSRIVPTDVENGTLRWGEVQDPTAFRMGGVAGDAGVFSTADDLARFAEMLLEGGSLQGARILRPDTVAAMTTAALLPGGSLRALGWDMASPYAVGLGTEFGPRSFGHTGYTGTALWIDPTTRSFVVILTSRLHPDGRGEAKTLRQQVAHVAAAAFRPPVLPGIDVLEDEGFAPLLGKRIGLLTNRAGRDLAGRRTIDVLATAPGLRLAAIFTPEHGLDSDREGRIAAARDGATGLPIYSLYGSVLHPTDKMLTGLDAVVIDLQDAGVRYFTYPTTVAYVLQAAARRGLEVFVLDRPNPIDGNVVEGPLLDPALRSFTGFFPMPLRHGMTLGELAMMFNTETRIGARLTVVPLQGYDPGSWYDQTGLDWINPSPNLRSVAEAALYPGVGMVEGADISVGRGTSRPFEVLGAPWIDGEALARYLDRRGIPGVRFVAAEFVPGSDRYAGRLCHGIGVTVTDRDRLDAGEFGLELTAALYRLYPDRFRLAAVTSMVGSRRVVAGIAAGDDPRDMARAWTADLDAYGRVRAKYLLYR